MPVSFLGYQLFSGDVATCADEIVSAVASRRRNCMIMACLNPHSYVVAHEDAAFRTALETADWLVPDGIGVVMAARWLGKPIKARVTGPDVFTAVMERLDRKKGSVFFLGSSEDNLIKIRDKVLESYPSISIVETYAPPFKEEFSKEDNATMISKINIVAPDILWVGLTAPKQEKWLNAHRDELNVGAAGAVGAAFDFFAGTVKRSPKLFRTLGLEWLPRLAQQPRRLWRRMFVSAPLFIFDVYRMRSSNRE